MKIRKVDVTTVEIPLVDPKRFGTRSASARYYTIVEIETESGIKGFGYCWGIPAVSMVVEMCKQHLIGEMATATTKIWQKLYHSLAVMDRRGIACRALGAIDVALWDIIGKAANLPIYQLIGGYRDEVQAYFSGGYYPVSCKTEKELLQFMESDFGTYRDRGFTAFKMKIGGMGTKFDLERIKLAREVIGPDALLMVDANNVYDVKTAIRFAAQFEKYDIDWFEEPCAVDQLNNCAQIAANVSMPVAIGENHFTRWDFKEIIESRAASVLQGDPTLMGGITEWLNLAGVAAMYGITLAPHWTHDVNVHVALARPEVKIVEYFEADADVFNVQRIFANPVMARNGMVSAAKGSGHGLVLDTKAVAKYRV